LKKDAKIFLHPYFKKEMYLKAYEGAIRSYLGEKHWPQKKMPLNPPKVKVMPRRTRKKRRKDPHKDPKKLGKLTHHGRKSNVVHVIT